MLEVGPDWLEPTKYDLTFTNVKTQKCLINNTEVIHNVVIDNSNNLNKQKITFPRFMSDVDNYNQVFKIVPESPSYTEFHIPEMNINIVPYPEKAELRGKNAPYYKVDQVFQKYKI